MHASACDIPYAAEACRTSHRYYRVRCTQVAKLSCLLQVYVKVDEQGTEAAATTTVGTGPTSVPKITELVGQQAFDLCVVNVVMLATCSTCGMLLNCGTVLVAVRMTDQLAQKFTEHRCLPAVPAAQVFDRPFLFFIVETTTQTVLFQGAITDPRKK